MTFEFLLEFFLSCPFTDDHGTLFLLNLPLPSTPISSFLSRSLPRALLRASSLKTAQNIDLAAAGRRNRSGSSSAHGSMQKELHAEQERGVGQRARRVRLGFDLLHRLSQESSNTLSNRTPRACAMLRRATANNYLKRKRSMRQNPPKKACIGRQAGARIIKATKRAPTSRRMSATRYLRFSSQTPSFSMTKSPAPPTPARSN